MTVLSSVEGGQAGRSLRLFETGKTALVQRYLPYDKNVVVRLTPKTQISDVYASVLVRRVLKSEKV